MNTRKKVSSILWGIVLIAVGVIFALDAFGVADINIFFKGWWTLFIIVPCTIGVFTEREKTGNIIGVCIGVALLLACRDIISFDMLWKLAIPAIIVIIGVKMIIRALVGGKSAEIKKRMREKGEKFKSECAIFGGHESKYDGEVFTGVELVAVFGGLECDLRGAIIEADCVIDATAIFGGIDIMLPQTVNVKVNSTSIFGGVSHKEHTNSQENKVTVYINGVAMFGGVDVK